MKVKLGGYIQEYSVRNKANEDIPVYSVTNTQGFCQDYFGKEVASKDKSTYKIVPRGYFAYNPSRINVGSVDWQRDEDQVIVSPLYNVFSVSPELNQQYLYYYLKSDFALHRIKAVATGSVRDNLKLEMLKNFPIRIPSVEEQEYIVQALDKAKNIIDLRRNELQKFDDLIRARFVEMFGNPLDKSKANMYFVECVDFNPKKSEVKDLMCETVSFVPMECVGADGSFKIKEDGLVKDYYKGYTYFKNGDVLLAKITPCFENGKVAIAENCTNGIGFGTTEFHVSRPIPGVRNSQWIKYMLKNEHVHELATINMTGSAGQKRIQTPFFEKLKVYLPPIELQNQFADFVSQIDKSKATVQKALDETQLLFDSLMQQYFG